MKVSYLTVEVLKGVALPKAVAIKSKRSAAISGFLDSVKEYPAIAKQVHEQYQQLEQKSAGAIFSSFIKLIKKLKEEEISFIIILRTFGKDLKEVASDVFDNTGVAFTKWGRFKKGVLHLEGDESRTIAKTQELFDFFAASQDHIAIKDSYKGWDSNDEQAMFGKKFPFDRGDPDRKLTNLSLFFDDNIKGNPTHDIVAPYTRDGTFVPTGELLGKHLFKVDPIQAILDDHYYIDRVRQAISMSFATTS